MLSRALKSVSYWRSEMAELKWVVAHRGDSVRYKRNHSRAQRRLNKILLEEWWPDCEAERRLKNAEGL